MRATNGFNGLAMVRDGSVPLRLPPPRFAPGHLAAALGDELEALDELTEASIGERLVGAAHGLAVAFDAQAWWVGNVDRTGRHRRFSSASPRGRAEASRLTEVLRQDELTWSDPRDPFSVQGSSMSLWAGDDPVIGEVMQAWGGVVTVAAAGGFDPGAQQWSLSLFGDVRTHDLRDVEVVLVAVVQACLGFPRPPRAVRGARVS
ncbi:hypothetical protein RDV89_18425 [Nocardioides zeae]|uniref:Uncharacterized protein n=1 Tax=Nocardioides imazamoxiresistens TaxID=3231893 RepID=A0ABU3Q0N4_9ACTN|nr:hypothetical protein [Nocardioides zeae]MDT9595070.1 hypothetical protein [Nocardioides zeae]